MVEQKSSKIKQKSALSGWRSSVNRKTPGEPESPDVPENPEEPENPDEPENPGELETQD